MLCKLYNIVCNGGTSHYGVKYIDLQFYPILCNILLYNHIFMLAHLSPRLIGELLVCIPMPPALIISLSVVCLSINNFKHL